MEIRKIKQHDKTISIEALNTIKAAIETTLKDIGIVCSLDIKNASKLRVSNIRINKDHWGYNEKADSERKGSYLSWNQWILFNYAINTIMDKYDISANISSLNGKFKIRHNKESYTIAAWRSLYYDNVGSIMYPVYRGCLWSPCNHEKEHNTLMDSVDHLIKVYHTHNLDELKNYFRMEA